MRMSASELVKNKSREPFHMSRQSRTYSHRNASGYYLTQPVRQVVESMETRCLKALTSYVTTAGNGRNPGCSSRSRLSWLTIHTIVSISSALSRSSWCSWCSWSSVITISTWCSCRKIKDPSCIQSLTSNEP